MAKSILKARKIISVGMRWRIGDRKSIKICDDRWIPSTETTKILSPRVLALEDATVDCLMNFDSGLWNSSVIDQHFLCFEAQRIEVIPVCVSRQVDCVNWQRCKNGGYSVKTGYQLLCEDEIFWSCIWKLRVPNKIKTFL